MARLKCILSKRGAVPLLLNWNASQWYTSEETGQGYDRRRSLHSVVKASGRPRTMLWVELYPPPRKKC